MKCEIDKDFYCSGGHYRDGWCLMSDSVHLYSCKLCHRKHPIPEQFKEEYGEEVPDDFPVWILNSSSNEECFGHRLPKEKVIWEDWKWVLVSYKQAKETISCGNNEFHKWGAIVCACTPFGMPGNDWRPE